MSTFLELVNDTERESGTVHQASRLSTVVDPKGRQEKIVGHVREAWRLIQNSRGDWPFMRRTATRDLIIGAASYGADTFIAPIGDFANWERGGDRRKRVMFSIYDAALGRVDETELFFMPFDDWSRVYDFGVHNANRPSYYTISPDGNLCLGPTPDKAYKVRLAYWCSPQILAADDDVPICKPKHHGTIVWRALMLLSGHDEAAFSLADAQTKFAAGFRDMVNDRDDYMEP